MVAIFVGLNLQVDRLLRPIPFFLVGERRLQRVKYLGLLLFTNFRGFQLLLDLLKNIFAIATIDRHYGDV